MEIKTECKEHTWAYSHNGGHCGVKVCIECGEHKGLSKCYCGWSKDGSDGYASLILDGETIEADY